MLNFGYFHVGVTKLIFVRTVRTIVKYILSINVLHQLEMVLNSNKNMIVKQASCNLFFVFLGQIQ